MATEPTKPVRVSQATANKLQTVQSMLAEMGEKFSTVKFLNGLIDDPVDKLHRETVERYTTHQKRKTPKKGGA